MSKEHSIIDSDEDEMPGNPKLNWIFNWVMILIFIAAVTLMVIRLF